ALQNAAIVVHGREDHRVGEASAPQRHGQSWVLEAKPRQPIEGQETQRGLAQRNRRRLGETAADRVVQNAVQHAARGYHTASDLDDARTVLLGLDVLGILVCGSLLGVLVFPTACAGALAPAPRSAWASLTAPGFDFVRDSFAFRNEIRARHPDTPDLYANYCF